MSALKTLSVFYYGTTITRDNQNLNFDEGSGELTAVVPIGDYSLSELITALEDALNLAGTLTYTVSLARSTRTLTISATGTFDLLTLTGSQVGTSCWDILGYTTASDHTGATSYACENGAGSEYRPQMLLSDYIQPEDYEVKESAVVNTSVNGVVQTLQFGDGQRMQCNIRGATTIVDICLTPFFENVNGVQALRDFMKYLITKAKIEFMPDVDDRDTYYKLLLESSGSDRNGTSFKLSNMDGTNNYFESGVLTFRKVIQ